MDGNNKWKYEDAWTDYESWCQEVIKRSRPTTPENPQPVMTVSPEAGINSPQDAAQLPHQAIQEKKVKGEKIDQLLPQDSIASVDSTLDSSETTAAAYSVLTQHDGLQSPIQIPPPHQGGDTSLHTSQEANKHSTKEVYDTICVTGNTQVDFPSKDVGRAIEAWRPLCNAQEVASSWQGFREHLSASSRQRLILEDNRNSEESGGSTTRREEVEESTRRDVGRWGEEFAWRILAMEMIRAQPDLEVKEAGNCLHLYSGDEITATIRWVNHGGEQYQSWDIEILKGGKIEKWIEVKSTEGESMEFELSEGERQKAEREKDNYGIIRVFGARTKAAWAPPLIFNPIQFCDDNHLAIRATRYLVRILRWPDHKAQTP